MQATISQFKISYEICDFILRRVADLGADFSLSDFTEAQKMSMEFLFPDHLKL